MKKSMRGIVFIGLLFPFTLLAQPQVGDLCHGLATYTSQNLCSIPLEGEDKNKVYTYAITYMNTGDKVGCLHANSLLYGAKPVGSGCMMIRPGTTNKMVVNSHFCTQAGTIAPDILAIASLARGWDEDFIQMEITEVSVINSSPKSDMRCSQMQYNRSLIGQGS